MADCSGDQLAFEKLTDDEFLEVVMLRGSTPQYDPMVMAIESLELLHRRLGHFNRISMDSLKKGITTGIDYGEEKRKVCQVCLLGKQSSNYLRRKVENVPQRSPHKVVLNATPEEKWSGEKVNLKHLKVWGSIAQAHVPDVLRKKFDPKSKQSFCGLQRVFLQNRLCQNREVQAPEEPAVLIPEESEQGGNMNRATPRRSEKERKTRESSDRILYHVSVISSDPVTVRESMQSPGHDRWKEVVDVSEYTAFVENNGWMLVDCLDFLNETLITMTFLTFDDTATNVVWLGLKNLKALYLVSNNISDLPDANAFQDLTSLQELILQDNHIIKLSSKVFDGLSNLKLLDLERFALPGNKLKHLDAQVFTGLSTLSTLLLDNNTLEGWDENSFTGLDNLKYVRLENNNLKTLSANMFGKVPHITRLGISSSSIRKIDSGTFSSLNKLEDLDLRNNLIDELPEGIFTFCKALQRIFLDGNKLQKVPNNVFANLTKLRVLYLDDNGI
ncbi:hypothetical protein ILUMI_06763 [Ignelater luminosus]|uniref:GAG-pre-integrase domain-containing protein n=1 Tax=Ignelater luminosus TaxID=2038154 RepID=A0A8K0DAH4_IGNLU|nr:hypothetical protein ILUMI_06763 [Ignelater luminosus]